MNTNIAESARKLFERRDMFLFKVNKALISIVTFLWGKENF